jgi:hypothetical protein
MVCLLRRQGQAEKEGDYEKHTLHSAKIQFNDVYASIISHDVFLGTLSRVINSFITRDKALRGTLCNSTYSETENEEVCKDMINPNRPEETLMYTSGRMRWQLLPNNAFRLSALTQAESFRRPE